MAEAGGRLRERNHVDTEEIARLKAKVDALFLEAKAALFAALPGPVHAERRDQNMKIRKKLGAVQIGDVELRLHYACGGTKRPSEKQQRALEALADALKVALPHIVAGLGEPETTNWDYGKTGGKS